MKIKFYKYEDQKNEIILPENGCMIIKDKFENKYYEVSRDKACNICWEEKIVYHSNALLLAYWGLFLALTIFNLVIFIWSKQIEVLSTGRFAICLLIYMIFFAIFHELGHLCMLNVYGRKANKVGFKFNYIFPSLYVQINDIYMLDKIQRLYIHSGGLMISLVMNVCVFWVGFICKKYEIVALAMYMSLTILYNMMPLMNSDGYKILLTLFGKAEKKENSNNPRLVSIIRGINVLFTLVYTVIFFVNIVGI